LNFEDLEKKTKHVEINWKSGMNFREFVPLGPKQWQTAVSALGEPFFPSYGLEKCRLKG